MKINHGEQNTTGVVLISFILLTVVCMTTTPQQTHKKKMGRYKSNPLLSTSLDCNTLWLVSRSVQRSTSLIRHTGAPSGDCECNAGDNGDCLQCKRRKRRQKIKINVKWGNCGRKPASSEEQQQKKKEAEKYTQQQLFSPHVAYDACGIHTMCSYRMPQWWWIRVKLRIFTQSVVNEHFERRFHSVDGSYSLNLEVVGWIFYLFLNDLRRLYNETVLAVIYDWIVIEYVHIKELMNISDEFWTVSKL